MGRQFASGLSLGVGGHAFLAKLGGPRCIRHPFLDIGADVGERGDRRRLAKRRQRRCTKTAAWRHAALPDAREVRLAVTQARRGRVHVRCAICRPRHVGTNEGRPLRRKRDRQQGPYDDCHCESHPADCIAPRPGPGTRADGPRPPPLSRPASRYPASRLSRLASFCPRKGRRTGHEPRQPEERMLAVYTRTRPRL